MGVRTRRHSDVRALPQQLSPSSCRSKHSNSFCSSLRRHPDHVSRLFKDVAHVFWHRTVNACSQHNRPDHSAPRWTAMMVKIIRPVKIWSYFKPSNFSNNLPCSVRFVHCQKSVWIEGQFRRKSVKPASFPLKLVVANWTRDNWKLKKHTFLILEDFHSNFSIKTIFFSFLGGKFDFSFADSSLKTILWKYIFDWSKKCSQARYFNSKKTWNLKILFKIWFVYTTTLYMLKLCMLLLNDISGFERIFEYQHNIYKQTYYNVAYDISVSSVWNWQ